MSLAPVKLDHRGFLIGTAAQQGARPPGEALRAAIVGSAPDAPGSRPASGSPTRRR